MPIQAAPKAIEVGRFSRFSGLDMRQDARNASPDSLATSINFDLHRIPGVLTSRRPGRKIAELGEKVVMMSSAGNNLYAGTEDGVLYRDFSQVSSGLGQKMTLIEYAGINQDTPIIYLAGTDSMKIIDGASISQWGISPPPAISSVLASEANGVLTGDFSIVYTYAKKVGQTLVTESNPSPPSLISANNEGINLTLTSSTDPQVTHIRIYRTQNGGSVHLFDKEIPNTVTTTTLTTPDASLGAAVDEDNGLPITSNHFTIFQDRAWLADNVSLYYSKRFRPEVFPALNTVKVGTTRDPIVAIVASRNGLAVFTRRRKFRMVESRGDVSAVGDELPFFGGSADSFIPVPSIGERGAASDLGAVDLAEGVLYVSQDGLYLTDLATGDQRVSDPIGSLFLGRDLPDADSINVMSMGSSVLGVHESRRYFSYAEKGNTENSKTAVFSGETGAWYLYDFGASAFYSDTESPGFYVGTPTGDVYVYEDYNQQSSESVVCTMRTQRLDFGQPFVRKLLQYVFIDADIPGGESLSVNVYADGASVHTYTVSADRAKVNMPGSLIGTDFQIEITSTSSNEIVIRGGDMAWLPMNLA